MPPTAPATTARRFHSASDTVSAKPSRSDFCTTTVERRCSALMVRWASGGSARTEMSDPRRRARGTSASTSAPSGSSSALPPASTRCASSSRRASRNASITPTGSLSRSKRDTCVTQGVPRGQVERREQQRSSIARLSSRFLSESGSIEGGTR